MRRDPRSGPGRSPGGTHRERPVAIGEKIGLYTDGPVPKGCIPPYVPVWVEGPAKRKA